MIRLTRIKFTAFFLSLSAILATSAFAAEDQYERIFTKDIYRTGNAGNQDYAVLLLRTKKKNRVKECLTNAMRNEINALYYRIDQSSNLHLAKASLAFLSAFAFPPSAPVAISHGANTLYTGHKADGSFREEIRKLRSKIQELEDGIDKEQIWSLECEYVKCKCQGRLPEKLQEIAEDVLLKSRRRGGYPNFNPYQFVRTVIAMPSAARDPLAGIEGESFQEKLSGLLGPAFEGKGPLALYDPKISDDIRGILANICRTASLENPSDDLRDIIILCGPPGCGKTHLAKAIASLCHLPCHEIGPDSEYRTNRCWYGSNPYSPEECKGILLETLLTQNDEKKCFLNPVLIINEIDEILKDPSGMKMLCDVLDPSKSSFKSPYFNCDLNCSKIIVIGTANETPGLKKGSEAQKESARAFWDRVNLVQMDHYSDSGTRRLLTEFVDQNQLTDKSAVHHEEGSAKRLVDHLMQYSGSLSLRLLKIEAKKLANLPEHRWDMSTDENTSCTEEWLFSSVQFDE